MCWLLYLKRHAWCFGLICLWCVVLIHVSRLFYSIVDYRTLVIAGISVSTWLLISFACFHILFTSPSINDKYFIGGCPKVFVRLRVLLLKELFLNLVLNDLFLNWFLTLLLLLICPWISIRTTKIIFSYDFCCDRSKTWLIPCWCCIIVVTLVSACW